jgi:hypothetical protein
MSSPATPVASSRRTGAATATTDASIGRPDPCRGRPIGALGFGGVAIASFGGPLALAALIAPGLLSDAAGSAGLAAVSAAVVFAVPLWIWLSYSRHVNGPGGLFAFVEAAAGRPIAYLQAAIWIFSYAMYLVYTTVQIADQILPDVFAGEHRFQTLLTILIPVSIAVVMIAGRVAALAVIGLIAAGQVVLVIALDVVTVGHLSTPVSSFAAGAPAGSLAKAGAQTSLLFVCGSLPLFLGGELANPARTIRRGLSASYLLTALVVVLAVAPFAAAPGLARTTIPGVSIAEQFSGRTFADAIGIGVAVSTAGVMLCEYLALSRLIHAISSIRINRVTVALGVAMIVAAPFVLIDPQGFYNTLSMPSLVALWLSQLIVFAVYPRFAVRHGARRLSAWMVGAGASGIAIYGVVTALAQNSS